MWNEMCVQTSKFANIFAQIKQMWLIFSHLKLSRGSETNGKQLQLSENLNKST